MRADQMLVSRGLAPTRSAAQRLIAQGAVRWLGARGWSVPRKAGDELPEGCEIEGSVGNEVIVDNDVGGSDQPCGAQGQQIECARTAADKKDSAGAVVS